jgi:hypothetical protein
VPVDKPAGDDNPRRFQDVSKFGHSEPVFYFDILNTSEIVKEAVLMKFLK